MLKSVTMLLVSSAAFRHMLVVRKSISGYWVERWVSDGVKTDCGDER